MILLFELFQPARTVYLEVALRVADGLSEEAGLLSDLGIRQLLSLFLMVSCPIRQGTFDIREFAFRPFYG